ncbi:MAG TPA: cation:proton antiporter [Thermoanaerobaculia bacterium]|nr:cation:proton antiporter [Thermoanaerobaculia bacterium]
MDSYLAVERMLLLLCADVAIIILAARLFGWLFGKVGQPPVVGEILAGVILGPSLLGRLYPGAIKTLLTPQTTTVLSALAQVGLILLMLLIGLEFPFDRLRQAAGASLAVAVAGILVPFASSYALAGWLYGLAPGSSSLEAFRLFFATAVSITAIPIMGRILMHTRLTRTRMGLTSITAAAMDDVLGWLLLGAVIATVTHGRLSPRTLLLSFAGVLLLAGLFWAAGRYGVARLRVPRTETGGLRAGWLALTLTVVFACAAATNALGVFSIFGGFLCGIAGSFHPELRDAIKTSIGDLVSVLFLPIFFVFSGLRTDVGSLGSESRLWWALGAVILVSCVSKFGATALAARATGLPWKESLSIGLLMNTRALMALVVINIGADMGVVSPAAFFWLVTMALFTTVITTPILRRAYPTPEAAQAWEEQPRPVRDRAHPR